MILKQAIFIDSQTSVFLRHTITVRAFSNYESWIISSIIEEEIKSKIKAVGTPLKDWNINIYRGVLTGYNEAFIIDQKKKEQLIAEDPKSVEIIRPILRGRDIKRYICDFSDLHLIATLPSKKINIDDYVAVKQHLMSFGYHRLNQSGEPGSRKKTTNKWFETQDAISYWEDFYRQKIVWKRVGSHLRFAYDTTGMLALDSTCFATGENIKYLLGILNSKMGKYLMKDSPKTGTGDLLISVQAIEPLKIPMPNTKDLLEIENGIDLILKYPHDLIIKEKTEKMISLIIYKLYQLDENEIEFIESQ